MKYRSFVVTSIGAYQEDAVRFDHRQLFDQHRLVEYLAASAALLDDEHARFGGQHQTVVGPRVAANDFVGEVGVETLRLPRLLPAIKKILRKFNQ